MLVRIAPDFATGLVSSRPSSGPVVVLVGPRPVNITAAGPGPPDSRRSSALVRAFFGRTRREEISLVINADREFVPRGVLDGDPFLLRYRLAFFGRSAEALQRTTVLIGEFGHNCLPRLEKRAATLRSACRIRVKLGISAKWDPSTLIGVSTVIRRHDPEVTTT
jgi:hypothetical protein